MSDEGVLGTLAKMSPLLNNFVARGAAIGWPAKAIVQYIANSFGPQGMQKAQRQDAVERLRSGRATPDEAGLGSDEDRRQRKVGIAGSVAGALAGGAAALAPGLMGAGAARGLAAAGVLGGGGQPEEMVESETIEEGAIQDPQVQQQQAQELPYFDRAVSKLGINLESIPPEVQARVGQLAEALNRAQEAGLPFEGREVSLLLKNLRNTVSQNSMVAGEQARVARWEQQGSVPGKGGQGNVDAQFQQLMSSLSQKFGL